MHHQLPPKEASQSSYTQEPLELQLDQLFEKKTQRKPRPLVQHRYKMRGYTFGQSKYVRSRSHPRTERRRKIPPVPATISPASWTPPSLSAWVCASPTTAVQLDSYSDRKKSEVPPLGVYEIKGLDKYGYYSNSKFKNACATIISPPKPQPSKMSSNPGPGYYDLPGGLNPTGQYFVSTFKTRHGWALGKKSLPFRRPYY